jgi:tetratricopeptide (TPR) repeat protein
MPAFRDVILFASALFLTTQLGQPETALAKSKKVPASQASSPSADSKRLLKEGRKQMAKKDYAGALESFSNAITAEPKNAELYFERGQTHYHLNEYDRAVADYDSALELGYKHAHKVKLARGKAKHYLAKYPEALHDFNAAIEQDPNNAHALMCRAAAHDSLGENQNAIKDLSKAIELEPGNPEAYLQRALQHKHLDMHAEALKDFEQALKIDPAMERWRTAFQPEEVSDARDIANLTNEVSLKTGRAKATALYNRGLVYSEVGQHEKAIEDFDAAIAENPDEADFYTQRGMSYFLSCNYEKAKEDLSKAITLEPQNADLYYKRALAQFQSGAKDNALADLGKAIELQPQMSANFYFKRALVYSHLGGKTKEAIADLDKAVEMKPNDPVYLLNRGMEYALLGDHAKAIADFDRAIEAKPSAAAIVYKNRALSKLENKDSAGAIKDLQEAAQIYQTEGDMFGSSQVKQLLAKIKK